MQRSTESSDELLRRGRSRSNIIAEDNNVPVLDTATADGIERRGGFEAICLRQRLFRGITAYEQSKHEEWKQTCGSTLTHNALKFTREYRNTAELRGRG